MGFGLLFYLFGGVQVGVEALDYVDLFLASRSGRPTSKLA